MAVVPMCESIIYGVAGGVIGALVALALLAAILRTKD